MLLNIGTSVSSRMKLARAFRHLQRAATVACILILCAVLMSKFWSIVCVSKSRGLACELDCGLIRLYWGGTIPADQPPIFFVHRSGTWTGWCIATFSRGFVPQHRANSGSGWNALDLPLVPLLALAIVAIPILRYLARRPVAPNFCPCGYDLTGNTSGRCPECGMLLKPHKLP